MKGDKQKQQQQRQKQQAYLIGGRYPVRRLTSSSIRLGDLPAHHLTLVVPLESLLPAGRLRMCACLAGVARKRAAVILSNANQHTAALEQHQEQQQQ